MHQLWLKFKDENGNVQRVEIKGELFTIGRHSANDLTISDSRLSREHVRIETADGDFFVSDSGSSNGTTLNGSKLTGPTSLKDRDKLDLGGGLEIVVEVEAPQEKFAAAALPDVADDTVGQSQVVPPVYSPAAAAITPEGGSIPTFFFILAPVLGLIVLVVVVGLIFLFGGSNSPDTADRGDDINYSTTDGDDAPSRDDVDTPSKTTKSPTPSNSSTPPNNGTTLSVPSGPGGTGPPPSDLTETAKVEQNGALFLRRSAQNDAKAFLTSDQAQKVNSKIKQIARSSTLAENINAARKSSAQIKSLASAKNLKPQFLAVAAISQLGNSRGDIVKTAQSISEVYDKLAVQIGNEFGEDTLLMVAAFDQGSAGETMKMRNMLQDLATKSPEGVRTIRSIWFLEKNGKISQVEFDRALNFLAIGTITQNPKEFGVNAEALVL